MTQQSPIPREGYDPIPMSKAPMMSNNVYDKLKWIAQILLPALGTLYYGLAKLWNLPAAEEVVGTIVLVDAFLGALLVVSTRQYEKGEFKYDGTAYVGERADGTKQASLVLKNYEDPSQVVQQKELLFKVRPVDVHRQDEEL